MNITRYQVVDSKILHALLRVDVRLIEPVVGFARRMQPTYPMAIAGDHRVVAAISRSSDGERNQARGAGFEPTLAFESDRDRSVAAGCGPDGLKQTDAHILRAN